MELHCITTWTTIILKFKGISKYNQKTSIFFWKGAGGKSHDLWDSLTQDQACVP